MREGMFGLLAQETILAHAIVVAQTLEPDRLCAL
jgi:hypothetical protein